MEWFHSCFRDGMAPFYCLVEKMEWSCFRVWLEGRDEFDSILVNTINHGPTCHSNMISSPFLSMLLCKSWTYSPPIVNLPVAPPHALACWPPCALAAPPPSLDPQSTRLLRRPAIPSCVLSFSWSSAWLLVHSLALGHGSRSRANRFLAMPTPCACRL
jgi:hypothetical protein